jgi:hypothetical protein
MLRLPDELKPYINDFKINLVEVRDNDLVFHNKDNKDLFSLLKIMYDGNMDRKTKREQLELYSSQCKVDQTVVKLIASVTNVDMGIFEKEDDVTVCELWDEVRQEGRQEGEARGEDKLARLISKLMTEKRFDDVTKAATDADYRRALYAEYQINA